MEDRQTDKSTRFAFTAYEGQWVFFKTNPPNDLIAEWGWQEEVCPTSKRLHLQGYLRTKRQVRLSQLRQIYKGVHFEIARNWSALKNYSDKIDSAVPGTRVSWVSEQKAQTMKETLVMIASNRDENIVGTLNRKFMADATGKLQPPKRSELQEEIIEEYWDSVKRILEDQPDLIGLLSQPQYQRSWVNTREVWIKMAKIELDRQTEKIEAENLA